MSLLIIPPNGAIEHPRGRRSKEALNRRRSRRAVVRIMKRIKASNRIGKPHLNSTSDDCADDRDLVHHPCSTLPTEFIKRVSQQEVTDIVQSRYARVKMGFVDGNVEVKCPSYAYFVKRKRGLKLTIERIMTSSLHRIYPSFLVKKFGVVVSEARMEEIKEKWRLFVETGAKPSRLKHKGRGKKPAFHFGIWRRYQNIPFITKDSKSQNEKQNTAADAFLTVIRDSFAREIAALTENYSPRLWSKQKR